MVMFARSVVASITDTKLTVILGSSLPGPHPNSNSQKNTWAADVNVVLTAVIATLKVWPRAPTAGDALTTVGVVTAALTLNDPRPTAVSRLPGPSGVVTATSRNPSAAPGAMLMRALIAVADRIDRFKTVM